VSIYLNQHGGQSIKKECPSAFGAEDGRLLAVAALVRIQPLFIVKTTHALRNIGNRCMDSIAKRLESVMGGVRGPDRGLGPDRGPDLGPGRQRFAAGATCTIAKSLRKCFVTRAENCMAQNAIRRWPLHFQRRRKRANTTATGNEKCAIYVG